MKSHSKKMNCKSGCFQCCEAEFSVFSGEAALIVAWFQTLNAEKRSELQDQWQAEPMSNKPKCAFLVSGACSVYEARPVICRTQGAPLCVIDEVKKTKELTACFLNFEGGEAIPKDQNSWFDLNRLTELQVIAENFFSKNNELTEKLSTLVNEEKRIPLRALNAFLSTL